MEIVRTTTIAANPGWTPAIPRPGNNMLAGFEHALSRVRLVRAINLLTNIHSSFNETLCCGEISLLIRKMARLLRLVPVAAFAGPRLVSLLANPRS
jgi:hypothetical protein